MPKRVPLPKGQAAQGLLSCCALIDLRGKRFGQGRHDGARGALRAANADDDRVWRVPKTSEDSLPSDPSLSTPTVATNLLKTN